MRAVTSLSAFRALQRGFATCARARPLWQPVLATVAAHSRVAAPTGGDVGALRFLNLHEYQSKDLMEAHGVLVRAAAYPIPAGRPAVPSQSHG